MTRVTAQADEVDLNTGVLAWMRVGQIYDLEHGQMDRQDSAIKLGRQAGAVGATIIMFLTLIITLFTKLL